MQVASTETVPAARHGSHGCASAQIVGVPHGEPPDPGAHRDVQHTASVSKRSLPRAQTLHGMRQAPPEQLPYLIQVPLLGKARSRVFSTGNDLLNFHLDERGGPGAGRRTGVILALLARVARGIGRMGRVGLGGETGIFGRVPHVASTMETPQRPSGENATPRERETFTTKEGMC